MSPPFVYVGRLPHWWSLARRGFRPDLRYLPKAAFFQATGLGMAPLRQLERWQHGRAVAEHELTQDPIFILGPMRSGTTHLHNLMGLDENLGFPTTLAAYSPEFFMTGAHALRPLFAGISPKKREMDEMAVSIDLPQEEEYSLFALTEHTFFFHMFYPRHARHFFDKYNLFETATERERGEWKVHYAWLMKKFSYACGGRRLVVKNPVNTGRIDMLLELFPRARFVSIHRDPYLVYPSTRHLYAKLLPVCQLQNIDDAEVDRNVLDFYRRQMEAYFAKREAIPEGQRVEIRFEDLERDPVGVMRGVYHGLELQGFEAYAIRLRAYLDSIEGYRKNSYPLTDELVATVNEHWGGIVRRLGYPIREQAQGAVKSAETVTFG